MTGQLSRHSRIEKGRSMDISLFEVLKFCFKFHVYIIYYNIVLYFKINVSLPVFLEKTELFITE